METKLQIIDGKELRKYKQHLFIAIPCKQTLK